MLIQTKPNQLIRAVYKTAFIILLTISTSAIGCTTINDSTRTVLIISSYPTNSFEEYGQQKIRNLTDTICIYYIDDFIIYKLNPILEFETGKVIHDTEPYFLYKKKGKTGVFYSTVRDSEGVKMAIDSAMAQYGFGTSKVNPPDENEWNHIETKGTKNQFIERYVIKNSNENSIRPDTMYLYFNKEYKMYDVSLSSILDSSKNNKLYKFRLLFNQKLISEKKTKIPAHEFSIEMKQVTAKMNKNELLLFERFKRMNQ